VTVPLMLLFALRTSLFIFPVLTFVLWRAVGPRILVAIAALLLGVVVPLLYAEVSPTNRGGYNFDYGVELINAHWVGVVAVFLLGVACFRSLQGARRARSAEGPAARPEPEPERDLELTGSR
jgi:hypothetical protein